MATSSELRAQERPVDSFGITQEPVPAGQLPRTAPSPARPQAPWRRRLFALTTGQTVASHLALLALCIPALLPMAWMVATSLKADTQIFTTQITFASLFPYPAHWGNYLGAMRAIPLMLYLKNTLMLCILSVIGAVGSSAIVAYGFAKMDFPGKGALFLVMISTMALPIQVTMVPVFALFRTLHWFGTYLPLVVPTFFGAPFFIFLLTQFYRTLPTELAEAARVDGAGEWRIFWQIMAPLSKPALITCALFQFMWTWNDLLGPLLYINDPAKYTLAYGLQQFVSIHGSEYSRLMAGSTIFVLPIIVLFFFAQKAFIQGIATTGGKN